MRLLTAPGVAGIAVVAVSPEERDAVLAATGVATGDPWLCAAAPPPRRTMLRFGEQVVDDVLLVSRANRSLELHLHGSPAVLAGLDQQFGLVREVEPSPAQRLLRSALGESQLALALEQVALDFGVGLAKLRTQPPGERQHALSLALERSRVAQAMVMPARVALIGRQNAGKSTLFNCLLQRERVVTGPRPGLTRDPVCEVTLLDGYPCELVDTAGEGDACDVVDRAAIDAARAEHGRALRVLVIDAAAGPVTSDLAAMADATLVVATKRDQVTAGFDASWPRRPDASVAARDTEPGAIRGQLGRLLRAARGLPVAGPVGGFAALDEEQHQLLLATLGGG